MKGCQNNNLHNPSIRYWPACSEQTLQEITQDITKFQDITQEMTEFAHNDSQHTLPICLTVKALSSERILAPLTTCKKVPLLCGAKHGLRRLVNGAMIALHHSRCAELMGGLLLGALPCGSACTTSSSDDVQSCRAMISAIF